MRRRVLVLTAVFALLGTAILRGAETRYDDVIYLDGLNQPSLRLKVLRRTPVAFSRELESVIGSLAERQMVEVIGVGENRDLVSARVATGPVRGWADAQALEAPPAELIARLRLMGTVIRANRYAIAAKRPVRSLSHFTMMRSSRSPTSQRNGLIRRRSSLCRRPALPTEGCT